MRTSIRRAAFRTRSARCEERCRRPRVRTSHSRTCSDRGPCNGDSRRHRKLRLRHRCVWGPFPSSLPTGLRARSGVLAQPAEHLTARAKSGAVTMVAGPVPLLSIAARLPRSPGPRAAVVERRVVRLPQRPFGSRRKLGPQCRLPIQPRLRRARRRPRASVHEGGTDPYIADDCYVQAARIGELPSPAVKLDNWFPHELYPQEEVHAVGTQVRGSR